MKAIVANINLGNMALEFIDKRILDDHYRGSWSSQHNRYDMDRIVKILSLLDTYVPKKTLMVIRTTDTSKRGNNSPEEESYAKFCNDAKKKTGIGTQDAMRKNIFVDLHRMGFIERYDKDENPIDLFSRKNVQYVSLSDFGLRLIRGTLLGQTYIFAKGINKLLGGYIEVILNLLQNYDLEHISIYEFMFFVSAVGTEASFSISVGQCAELMQEYNNLSPIQHKAVVETLKSTLEPEHYSGDKTSKRDWKNWHNKAQQVFGLLHETVYFDTVNKKQILSLKQIDSKGDVGQHPPKKLKRSSGEKDEYFSQHTVEKQEGFELHHVVPLAWSESEHHFNLLDTWKNMVYIDAFNHARITQNRNRNVVMAVSENDINDLVLKDYCNHEVYLKNNENISYDTRKQKSMLDHNSRLLNTVNK